MITVYGTSWCVFCKKATKLLTQKGVSYEYKSLDEQNNITELTNLLGHRPNSIPVIFAEDDLIGGYQDLLLYLDE